MKRFASFLLFAYALAPAQANSSLRRKLSNDLFVPTHMPSVSPVETEEVNGNDTTAELGDVEVNDSLEANGNETTAEVEDEDGEVDDSLELNGNETTAEVEDGEVDDSLEVEDEDGEVDDSLEVDSEDGEADDTGIARMEK
jgi:hypothetical protein